MAVGTSTGQVMYIKYVSVRNFTLKLAFQCVYVSRETHPRIYRGSRHWGIIIWARDGWVLQRAVLSQHLEEFWFAWATGPGRSRGSCCEHVSCVLSTGLEHHFPECAEENSVVTEGWNSARFLLWESHSASEYVSKALRIPLDKKCFQWVFSKCVCPGHLFPLAPLPEPRAVAARGAAPTSAGLRSVNEMASEAEVHLFSFLQGRAYTLVSLLSPGTGLRPCSG